MTSFLRGAPLLRKILDPPLGRLAFGQKFRNFRNGDKWYENFLGKVPENQEIVEFSESKPFNQKFWKFQDESQMEREFPGKFFSKIWVYLTRLSSFSEFMQICNFLLSASSFGPINVSWASHTRMMATRNRY